MWPQDPTYRHIETGAEVTAAVYGGGMTIVQAPTGPEVLHRSWWVVRGPAPEEAPNHRTERRWAYTVWCPEEFEACFEPMQP